MDRTTIVTPADSQESIFNAVDHYAAECVGVHAAKYDSQFEALEPMRQGVRASCGTCGKAVACSLLLRHDHGSQYLSRVLQEEVAFLGIERSPAFVREPQDHGCAERFNRTRKENRL